MPPLDVDALYDEFAEPSPRQQPDEQQPDQAEEPDDREPHGNRVLLHDHTVAHDNVLRCAFCNVRSPQGAAMPNNWEWTKEARIACVQCAPVVIPYRRSRR